MQRAEHQVSGLRGGHCHHDRLGIAQLADKDYVRVLAHGRSHAIGKATHVRIQLALDDLTVLARMNEFDRVFETDDV